MKIKTISFKGYFETTNKSEFDTYLLKAILSPIDYFEIGSLSMCSMGFVKDLQHYFTNIKRTKETFLDISLKMFQLIAEEKNQDVELYFDKNIHECFQTFLYICKSIEEINEAEKNGLGGEASVKEIKAGIDRFNKYGVYTQIRKLCNNDFLKKEEVLKAKYNDCFIELLYQKDLAEFKEDYSRIK